MSLDSKESAGRIKSSTILPGDRYVKGALGIAALSISRHPTGAYLVARYKRIFVRCGKKRPSSSPSTPSSLLSGTCLPRASATTSLGPDFFTKKDSTRAKNNAVRRLRELGYHVTFSPREEA